MSAPVPVQHVLPFAAEEQSASRLIEELARVCREQPLAEKILVAPSLLIGHQIVERLALTGTRWVNLRVATVWNLAHALIGAALARDGYRLLSRAQALALVEQACADTLREGSYFGELRDRPGLHRAMQRSLDELRAVGLTPAALPDGAFADRRKAAEIREILRRYEAALAEGRFVDRADLMRRATAALAGRPGVGSALHLLPEAMELSVEEKRFLQALAGASLRTLPSDQPADWVRVGRTARIFRALGEENEVREVFRRLLADGTSFDRAELLHTDSATYPPLVYELASEHGVPCTFAGGIAATFTRPGRAALAFLEWLGGGFDADVLRRALAGGVLTLKRFGPAADVSHAEVVRAIRQARIGWGRERHLSCLDRLIHALSQTDASAARQEDAADQARRQAWLARRVAAARVARRFLARAIELAPRSSSDDVELKTLARGAREFVSLFARLAGDLDATASTALERLFGELEMLPSSRLAPSRAAERLADAVRGLYVAADRPRPGRLHVGEYRSGGWSGRPQTYLVGLDGARHPGADLQDPVLLDEERRGINQAVAAADLALWTQRPEEKARALQACIARLSGNLTASYSSWDLGNLTQPGERSPSRFLLDLHREASGQRDADYSRLDADLPKAAGFIPSERSALDEVEWWLSRLPLTDAQGEADRVVRGFYPALREGHRAEVHREAPEFSPWDGWVRPESPALDPRVSREPMSCSRIETLAKCQYMYFLKYVLELRPLEELERDTTRWLDPMEAGSLLHEVFRRFFEELAAPDKRPIFDRDITAIERIAEEEIDRWRVKIPPASELAFSTRREELLFACRTFLRLEAVYCAGVTPRFFEVPFGMTRSGAPSAIASAEPVEIPLGNRGSFLLRGCIDRIDQAPDGAYHVWDYKTGNPYPFREELGLDGGRQVQYALYAMALEELLKRAAQPGHVRQSGYFFPGRKGQGQRFLRPLEPEETRTLLNSLFDVVKEGAFAHTSDPEDCRFCDYKIVCGGVEVATDRARVKDPAKAPAALQAFWNRYGRKNGD